MHSAWFLMNFCLRLDMKDLICEIFNVKSRYWRLSKGRDKSKTRAEQELNKNKI